MVVLFRIVTVTEWQKVPCKLWTKAMYKKTGYGKLKRGGKTTYAHRWAWTEAHGPIPPGVQVCHRCDIRSCYEVKHLFLGTGKDNMQDCVAKGRYWNSRKLTIEQVKEIRARYSAGGVSYRVLAADYGVTSWTVGDILRGKTWTHAA